MGLIHTCQLCGTNSFDYLVELQRYAQGTGGPTRGMDALELPRPWRALGHHEPLLPTSPHVVSTCYCRRCG